MKQLAFSALALICLATCLAERTVYTPLAPDVPRPRLPQNDAYLGNVHRAESLRPRFVWEGVVSTTADPVVYQFQVSADESFLDPVVSEDTEDTSFQLKTALPVSMLAPVGHRYFWRVRACVRNSCSEYSRRWWVNLGRNNKDYNGDGDADVAVASSSEGVVHVLYGGPGNVFDTAIDATLKEPAASVFGGSVATAGDVNSDGFADLVVGAHGSATAYLYLGGPISVDTTADATLRGGASSLHGLAVSTAGDLDSDGYSDFVVGAPYADTEFDSGAVTVYFGSKTGEPERQAVLVSTFDDQIGRTVAPAGDMNGDGFADLAASSLGHNNFGTVSVFLGGAELAKTPIIKVPGNVTEDFYGAALASADFNEDGFSDLVVGVVAFESERRGGRVDIYLGGEKIDRDSDLAIEGSAVSDKVGQAVSTGDVNGDGHADLVIGALAKTGLSSVRVHLGQPAALFSSTPATSLMGSISTDRYGSSVSLADFNGDGVDDMAVTAPGNGAGRVYVHFGQKDGALGSSPDGIVEPSLGTIGGPLANP